MADISSTTLSAIEESDIPKPLDQDIIDHLVDLVKVRDEEGILDLQTKIGDDQYIQALDQAYIQQIQDCYAVCALILSPRPTTNPPNRLKEVIDFLWGEDRQLNPDKQKIKNESFYILVLLKWLRDRYIMQLAKRRGAKLLTFINKYINPDSSYAEVFGKGELVNDMILSLPNIDKIKDQFISDAESLFSCKRMDGESEELYIIRLSKMLNNYQLFAELAAASRRVLSASYDDKIDTPFTMKQAPDFIHDLAVLRDDKMQLLNKVLTPPELIAKLDEGGFDTEDTDSDNNNSVTSSQKWAESIPAPLDNIQNQTDGLDIL